MRHDKRRLVAVAILALAASVAIACGSNGSEPDLPAPRPGPTVTAPTAPSPAGYDPTAAMFGLFSGFDHRQVDTEKALALILENDDLSQVPVLVEMLRFPAFGRFAFEIGATLQGLTGQTFESSDWTGWMEWLGQHRLEFRPPEKYAEWKIEVLATVDPRFSVFLRKAEETSRIDLTEVVWGSVEVDGIPDLSYPLAVYPEEADYLRSDERIFGVSINGVRRAYPLRIVNAHEMVNDLLGGEPIALAW